MFSTESTVEFMEGTIGHRIHGIVMQGDHPAIRRCQLQIGCSGFGDRSRTDSEIPRWLPAAVPVSPLCHGRSEDISFREGFSGIDTVFYGRFDFCLQRLMLLELSIADIADVDHIRFFSIRTVVLDLIDLSVFSQMDSDLIGAFPFFLYRSAVSGRISQFIIADMETEDMCIVITGIVGTAQFHIVIIAAGQRPLIDIAHDRRTIVIVRLIQDKLPLQIFDITSMSGAAADQTVPSRDQRDLLSL